MTNQHPITPPPELVKQWWKDSQQADYSDALPSSLDYVATQAARWGADQELEACCSEVSWNGNKALAAELRTRRRPKPPSLKEQALALLEVEHGLNVEDLDLLRRALEALPND